MEFGVLGPVVVRCDGQDEPLGGPKQRALLAMLLLRANEIVGRDELIDGLWGERPPPTAGHTLDNYLSRLRKVVGDDRVQRRPPGYALRVEAGELDLDRFERALRDAGEALARDAPAEAVTLLREGLALWRGEPLADLRYEPFAQEAIARIEARRLQALEQRLQAELTLGGGAELVPELEDLVREHPFQERLLGQLMLALYRAGRQADALSAFQAGRRRLAEDLGLEPGPELQRLQEMILAQDPELSPRRERRQAPTLSRSASAAWAGVAVVATVALASILIGTGGSGARIAAGAGSRVIALTAGGGDTSRSVSLPGSPTAMASGYGALWLAVPERGEVLRLDPVSGAAGDRVPVGDGPGALALGGGSVWAANVPGEAITRIDPESGRVTQTLHLGSARVVALAYGAGALWVADSVGNALLDVDPASGQVRRRLPLEIKPSSVAVRDSAIWVADYGGAAIARVDPDTGQTVAIVHVGNGPAALAIGKDAVWVANALDSTVSKVDAATASLRATIPVGSGPTAIAIRDNAVWVANQYSSSVTQIDALGRAGVRTHKVAGAPIALDASGDTVWVGVRSLVEHRGGTLRLLHTRPLRLDPALQADVLPLQSDRLTRSGLVAYNHVAGAAGTQLVPDLAVALPTPTSRGTVYTFTLRPAIQYSDGRTVRARDFRRAIERVLTLRSELGAGFRNLVGAQACQDMRGARCDLARGIATDEATRTVAFHLRSADPEFVTSLALAAATPVPPGTPFSNAGLHPIPGTGPYKVVSATPGAVRYVRNPYFRERSHAAQPDGNPDEIVMRFGLSAKQQTREIAAGRADWAVDNVSPALLPGLRARFPGRFHHWAIPTTDFLQFNLTLAPFDDIRVRRAFNLAIDRREIVRHYGGPDVATPTCQVLPPGLSGYRSYCPYTRQRTPAGAPDIARARRLVAASGTRGTRVTVWGWTDDPTITPTTIRYAATVLRRLGYRTRVHLVPHDRLDAPLRTIQVIAGAWGGDTPNSMLSTWFACDGTNVHGWFCDRRIDRQLRRAQTVKLTNPRAAATIWAAIDRRLVDRAAWVPMVNELGLDFISARVRNYQFHPYWGLIADQIWLAGASR